MSKSKHTLQERVSDKEQQIEKKIKELKQLQAQKKRLESQRKEDERKKRTHRLIQVGAAVESVLGCPIEEKDIPKLINYLKDQEYRGRYFSKAMEAEAEEDMASDISGFETDSYSDETL